MKLAEIQLRKDYAVNRGRSGKYFSKYAHKVRTLGRRKVKTRGRTTYKFINKTMFACQMFGKNGEKLHGEADATPHGEMRSGSQVSPKGHPLVCVFEPRVFWGDWVAWQEKSKKITADASKSTRERERGQALAVRLETALATAGFVTESPSRRVTWRWGGINVVLDNDAAEMLAAEFESWADN